MSKNLILLAKSFARVAFVQKLLDKDIKLKINRKVKMLLP